MTNFLIFDLTSDNVLKHLEKYGKPYKLRFHLDFHIAACGNMMMKMCLTGMYHFPYPYLAQLGSHHERRHAIIVEHCLQAAVRVKLGTFDQQQVVHLCKETCVVLGVVRDVH